MGDSDLVCLYAAAGGMSRGRGGGRAPAVERRQATADDGDAGILGWLGTAPELAGDGQGVSDELGGGVSIGGMVCAVGSGAPGTAGRRVGRARRDSLGKRQAG